MKVIKAGRRVMLTYWLLFMVLCVAGVAGYFLFYNSSSQPDDIIQTSQDEKRQAKLLLVYREQISEIKNNYVYFRNGDSLQYDSGIKHKTFLDSLNNADVQDHFCQPYPKGQTFSRPAVNQDPGRFRCDTFFKIMYGRTAKEVESNLEEIVWCPKTVGQIIKINKRNGVSEKVKKISEELDGDTTLTPFLRQIAGSFVWRKISGTNRNSTHSYGITIDINLSKSHYWQWDCNCTDETAPLGYFNKIPFKIVEIFEKHGFIWGGKWYHYDTMHFEYRPELI